MITDRAVPGGFCNPDAPGADIDAVALYRDAFWIGRAAAVAAVDDRFTAGGRDTPCQGVANPNADPEAILGQPDADTGDGAGVYSLAGGSVFLEMTEQMENGDTLVVYELDPEDEVEEDCFQVYIGYYTENGDMAFTDEAPQDWTQPRPTNSSCGELSMVIDGLW